MFSSLELTIFLIYVLIMFVFGSLLNTIVLIVYFKYPKNYPFVFILISLTLLNLSSSILQVPLLSAYELQMFPVNVAYCRFEYFVSYFINGQSLTALVLIAYECYTMINESKKLSGIRMRTKIAGSILFWLGTLYPIAVIIRVDIDKKTNQCLLNPELLFTILSALIIFVFLVFISVFYLKLYCIVRKHANKVSFSIKRSVVKKLGELSLTQSRNDSDKQKNKNYANIRKSWNITRKFLLVVNIFLNLYRLILTVNPFNHPI